MIDIPGIGPTRRKALEAAGIDTLEALLYRFPVSFRDYRRPTALCDVKPGMQIAFRGEVMEPPRRQFARGLNILSVRIADGTGELLCQWFNQPYLASKLIQGSEWLFFGMISERKGVWHAVNPAMDDPNAKAGLEPVYAPVKGIPAKVYAEAVRLALELHGEDVRDALPESFRARYHLPEMKAAIRDAHCPREMGQLERARRALAFQELLFYQLALMRQRADHRPGVAIRAAKGDLAPLLDAFPFGLTWAQSRVLDDILGDLSGGRAMARLVQGDVGSGKTALAFLALYAAFVRGYQGAMMAPTEVLARQHYAEARKLLEPLGARVELLTGALTLKEREAARERVRTGEADIVVGTHALITPQVGYARLALVITDEQHRFGVGQRTRLSDKGEAVNVLVMSATPIPRTLSLILYGDLDISIVDELPPGRTPIRTHVVGEAKRQDMYGFLERQVAEGGQVYVVCPLVEESEAMDEPSAQERFAQLREIFPQLRVGLVHGRMSAKDKAAALDAFAVGEMHILVSTTVIEVGVNVPNANVMVIEGADRFGLAQLHQLRGRVGRGARASFCFLMGKSEKLRFLSKASDGFAIAQKDLEMRGPGEMLGTRQHGAIDGRLAALAADVSLLHETHEAALVLLESAREDEEAREIVREAVERLSEKTAQMARN